MKTIAIWLACLVACLVCVVVPRIALADEAFDTEGEAYARCVAFKDYYQGLYGSGYTWTCEGPRNYTETQKYYETCAEGPGDPHHCPAGNNSTHFYFLISGSCAAKEDTHSVLTWPAGVEVTGGNVCVGGCEAYRTDGTQGTDSAGNTGFVGMLHYTDAVCAPDANSPASTTGDEDEECIPVEGLTMCHNMATGEKCTIASTGKKFCWTAGDTSPKTSSDGTQAADKAPSPETPTPPTPTTDWTETQSATTNETATTNGTPTTTTSTTVIYNNTGDGGGDDGGGDDGGGDDGGGDDGGDGEGGDSECTGVGSDCTGAGDATEGIAEGDVYEGDDTTVAQAVTTYKAAVLATPIMQATTGFFVVNVSGSCPALEVEESAYWDAMSFTHHCSGPLAEALQLAGYFMLAIAAYAAFKIGFG